MIFLLLAIFYEWGAFTDIYERKIHFNLRFRFFFRSVDELGSFYIFMIDGSNQCI